jgi:hypothetical protein
MQELGVFSAMADKPLSRQKTDELIIMALKKVTGIAGAVPLLDEDRRRVLEIEREAEERSLLGLGKVINIGVQEVMKCALIYVAMTDMNFDWTRHSNLNLKKGSVLVGEEVRDEEKICRLAEDKNVWFMHKNFVVYKDKVSFPQDIMKKVCHFEIPSLPADWCVVEGGEFQCKSIVYGCTATPGDVFLKEKYFKGKDEKGSGTILVGVQM